MMRVQWLSSAALLALFAAPSLSAQQVTTNEPFTLKITGSQSVALQSVTDPSNTLNSGGSIVKSDNNSLQIVSRNRFKLNAEGKNDSITYGGMIALQAADGVVDMSPGAAYVYVSPNGLGTLEIGEHGYNTDYAGFDSSMAWGGGGYGFGPDYGWGVHATGFDGGGFGELYGQADLIDGGFAPTADDGNKISYSTPDLAGFNATVAYSPNDGRKTNWKGNRTKYGANAPAYTNIIGAGASYTAKDLGGVDLTVAGSYILGTAGKGSADAVGSNDLGAFGVRGAVSAYGLMVQFVYNNFGKSGQAKPAKGAKDTARDVAGFIGSVGYAIDAFQIGAYYGSGSVAAVGSAKAIATTSLGFGASYNIASGAQLFAGYETFDTDAYKDAKPVFDDKASAITVGMGLTF